MKTFILFIVFLLTSFFSYTQSSNYVRAYTKSNGTYVQGHYKTTIDRTNHNNWSTKYNTNPYNFNKGSRAKDYSYEAINYGKGRTIYKGTRGGQYYKNNKNNKIYVPKRNY